MKIHKPASVSVLLAAVALASAAQVQVFPLGADNTLVRVESPARYLLVPVQESMPDSKIDILVNGRVEQTIYVRLADSNIDYTVPLDLTAYSGEGPVTLNVVSEVDRTHSRNASDFVCWEALATADSYDTSNREKYRPAYHHTPLYGWMNDPNGMFYKDGVWHLYYQYNPYGSKWQNMTWGHSTSTDLVNWEHRDLAIEPNGLGSVFSGSAVVDRDNTAGFGEDAVVALYTSCGRSQVQSLAYSTDDGESFTFYAANPVIANRTEARDPNVLWHEASGRWVLVLAHALEKEIQIYTSPNLRDWTLQSAFGKGCGAQDGVWECPDLFELPVQGEDTRKWVLIVNINPGAPMGGSGTQYFVGEFDGSTFTADSTEAKWMDFGKDHYATVSWSGAPDGRRTAIGWMSNWQYANEVPTRQFRSANTLPRELGLFRAPDGEIYLSSKPSPELAALRGECKSYGRRKVSSSPLNIPIPALAEIVVDYDARQCASFSLTLSNAEGEEVVMTLDPRAGSFAVDRTRSGLTGFSSHFPAVTAAPTLGAPATGTLRIFVDRSSVEVFDSEGRFVLTNLVFPENPYTKLTVRAAQGSVRIEHVDVYTITENKN